jgi:glycosyltransferase involved in cell wall biosynthesis
LESPSGAPSPAVDRRLKVATLVHVVAPGGAETMAVESAIGLDPERWRRLLVVGRELDSEATEAATAEMLATVRAADVDVLRLRRSSRLELWAWWPFYRLLRHGKVDVLHAHMFGSNVWACVIGKLARVPVIVCHEHMWSYGGSRLRIFIDRWLIARVSDAFVAVSESGRRSMIESEGIPDHDVVLLRNGPPSLPRGVPGRVREELGIAPDQPVLTTVGILRAEKAHSVLIEAAARIVKTAPDLRVLIVGDGVERGNLEALIERLGLGDVVTLMGIRRDIADILESTDVAVCCSDFEGGPLSVMEYMSAELPIIATEVGGLPELVGPQSGVLIPPRDPGALADAAVALIGDPERRRRLGRSGAELREADYGAAVYIDRLEALYDKLLKAAGGRARRP